MQTEEQLRQMNERLERMEYKLDDLYQNKVAQQPVWMSFMKGFIVVFVVGVLAFTVLMLFID